MPENDVASMPADVPEFEGILEAVLVQALDIAREKLVSEGEVVPFTALAVGDNLFIETHPAEDTEDCFKMARHTVQNARGAAAYAFCYDGYVETDDGEEDALIAEGGVPGSSEGHAVGYLYQWAEEDDEPVIQDRAIYIGSAPNFMEFTLELDGEGSDEDDLDASPYVDDEFSGDQDDQDWDDVDESEDEGE